MLVRGVIDDQVDHDADAPVGGLVDQLGEVAQRSQARVHAVVVGDIVAVVTQRRRVHRVEPEACHAQPGQVVETADQARQVADAVAVRVLEGVDLQVVEDRLLVPALGTCAHSARVDGSGSPRSPRAGPRCHQGRLLAGLLRRLGGASGLWLGSQERRGPGPWRPPRRRRRDGDGLPRPSAGRRRRVPPAIQQAQQPLQDVGTPELLIDNCSAHASTSSSRSPPAECRSQRRREEPHSKSCTWCRCRSREGCTSTPDLAVRAEPKPPIAEGSDFVGPSVKGGGSAELRRQS